MKNKNDWNGDAIDLRFLLPPLSLTNRIVDNSYEIVVCMQGHVNRFKMNLKQASSDLYEYMFCCIMLKRDIV